MALARNTFVSSVQIALNPNGTFSSAIRTQTKQIIDNTDGSIEAERQLVDPITLAQLKTFVAGLS